MAAQHRPDAPPAPNPVKGWLPPGRRAAVCFSVDDVHPGRSTDPYEAGGDLGAGALGHVEWLLERHPYLHASLFVTPDWREISPVATRRLRARLPVVRRRAFLTPVHAPGTMRLDRHPEFVRYLLGLPRTRVELHGLHHVHPGTTIHVEFQDQDVEECRSMLLEGLRIFEEAGLPRPSGMTPPGWDAPAPLLTAMASVGLGWVASSRDVRTPVSASATTAMSGLAGVSLIHPERLRSADLLHFTANIQATSSVDRAVEIVEHGGLVSVKAHIVKDALGHVMADGLDELYRNYLDLLFGRLHGQYGDSIWWTTFHDIAEVTSAAEQVPAER